MNKITIAQGVAHTVPADVRKALTTTKEIQTLWNSLTPLSRNEWICWIESAKKSKTRQHRIKRTQEELREGKRRPCCWAGCIHR